MQLPQGRNPDVLVIGGGVSGLTTAVSLASGGFSVMLVEQKQHCGGRTYSFIHKETGDEVDNGQHLMMGCYHSTLRYLSAIGASSRVAIQKSLTVTFRDAVGGVFRLHSGPFPAPADVLFGLLRLKSLTLFQRVSLLRVGLALLFAKPDSDRELQSTTVEQWLDRLHQPKENKEYLWNIIAIGTLNDSPAIVSAALFVKVLRSAFLGKKGDSAMVIPREGLSDVLVDGAVDYLKHRSCEVRTGVAVDRLAVENNAVVHCVLSTGVAVTPRAVVSAVPYFDVARLFGEETDRVLPELSRTDHFVSSPIVTIHLWFDKKFMEEEFVALLGSPVHWVFNKSKLLKRTNGSFEYLSLVISGAAGLIGLEKEELVALGISELKRFYPASGEAELVHSLVIKEKRATFSPRVGMDEVPAGEYDFTQEFLFSGGLDQHEIAGHD